MYLIDSNIFLEILLDQERAGKVKEFLQLKSIQELNTTDFSLYSICIVLSKEKLEKTLLSFLDKGIINKVNVISINPSQLRNVIENAKKSNLDFDDAYQYTAAKMHNLQLVSFDKDFDKTDIKRIEL